jgi:hypothetical protein
MRAIVVVWRDLHCQCQHVPGPEGLDVRVLILNIIILTSLAWGFTLDLPVVDIFALCQWEAAQALSQSHTSSGVCSLHFALMF